MLSPCLTHELSLQFPFCLASGAIVQDSMSVEYYLSKCLKVYYTPCIYRIVGSNSYQINAKGEAIEIFMKDEKLPTETVRWSSAQVHRHPAKSL